MAKMTDLTKRETEAMLLVAEGLPNAKIAFRMGIAKGTAIRHVRAILRKLQLENRTTIAIYCYKNGLVKNETIPG